jgi:hypothetical protein
MHRRAASRFAPATDVAPRGGEEPLLRALRSPASRKSRSSRKNPRFSAAFAPPFSGAIPACSSPLENLSNYSPDPAKKISGRREEMGGKHRGAAAVILWKIVVVSVEIVAEFLMGTFRKAAEKLRSSFGS